MAAMSVEAADARLKQAIDWARGALGEPDLSVSPISGDASFRRYFRIQAGAAASSLVLMDAPPRREDSRPFLDVAGRLREAGLHAPEILHFDLELGFGIIEDLGDTLYREVVDQDSAPALFPTLFDVLAVLAQEVSCEGLPPYDAALLQAEMDLFPDWYLGRHKNRSLSATELGCWRAMCHGLIDNAARQPQVFVHKDFHSCNLMWRGGRSPGIIDFQDAVRGPLSYDFISLVWDRYIAWPRPQLESWMAETYGRLEPGFGLDEWVRHCDLMGLQRNLKVVGIFARLHYRDHKQGYLDMIPAFYRYLLDVLPNYPEFDEFRALLEDTSCAP